MLKDSMMFKQGFLGTEALFYMDASTIYFSILPFLMFGSILFAIKRDIKKHFISQFIIFIVTFVVVILFEIGLRIEGGFIEYEANSRFSFPVLFSFLTVHIDIAIMTLLTWAYLLVATLRAYKNKQLNTQKREIHKKLGRYVFIGIIITSIMGILLYVMLFVY